MYVPALESHSLIEGKCAVVTSNVNAAKCRRDKARTLAHSYIVAFVPYAAAGNESTASPVACNSLRLAAVSSARASLKTEMEKNEKLAATI